MLLDIPAVQKTLAVESVDGWLLYDFHGSNRIAVSLAGLAGATISLAVSPGWFSELTTSGQGWIAVGLVIFAQWDPVRASFGAYAFGALRRLILDIQGPQEIFGAANPFFYNPYLGFFLQMLPYAFTIAILVIGSPTV